MVTLGGESDTLTRDPAVATLELDVVDRSGNVTPIGGGPIGQTNIDLGDVQQSLVGSLQLTGKDASGNAVVFGATPVVEVGLLDGANIPLFVQRKGDFARMPGTIADDRAAPLLAASPRAIYYAGGTVASATSPPGLGGYDLLLLQDFGDPCPVTVDAQSFALVQLAQQNGLGDYAVGALLDDAGITEVGLPSCQASVQSNTLADGGPAPWAGVAGGKTVMGDDGTAYVVGPSELDAGAPTNAILTLPPSGDGGVLSSSAPRAGAATTWAPGRGVFLYGGGGADASAAEVVASTGTASPICATPDPATGLAAIALDAKTLLLAGDGNQARAIDVSNSTNCAQPWGSTDNLPPPLTAATLFDLHDGAFLLVGDDSTGATLAFRIDATSNTPKPLEIARHGARAVQTQTGAVIVLGGGSATPESYVD